VEGTRKRFRIVTAALTFGGLGLILATVFYPSEAVDQQALQAFKAPPHMVQPETVDSAPASPAASDLMPLTQQTTTGETARMPDPIPATQQSATASGAGGAATAFAQVHRTEAPERNEVCAAHGMQREYYYRGTWRYWRCIKR
jgi:hypothetical protein